MNRYPSNKPSLRDTLIVAGLVFGLFLGVPTIAAGSGSQAQVHSADMSTAISDRDVTARVKQRLEEKGNLSNANIGVTTVNGVVTLSGTVSDRYAKAAAVTLALQVEGVRVLEDDLNTASDYKPGAEPRAARHATSPTVSDSRITADVKALLADSLPAHYKVTVRTEHGVVILSGELWDGHSIERLREMVAKVDGVKGVNTLGLDYPYVTMVY
jgi:hyperosmotically inducible protein